MKETFGADHAVIAGGWLLGGLVVGLVLDRVVLRRFVKRMTMTKWGADDVAVGAVRYLVVPWFAIAGAFGARLSLPFEPEVATVIDRILYSALIISATIAVARLAGDVLKLASLRSEGAMRSSSIFVNISRLIVFLIGLLILLQTLGVSITPLLTALGVGGLAAALALQDTLANLFAGIHLIASKKVRPGDYIMLDTGQEGYVVDVNWRNTEMRQLPNNMVLVPNSKLAAAVVTNYHMPETEMSLQIEVGVAYGSDLDEVERITKEVAREVLKDVPGGVTDWEPVVRFHTFGDSSVDFTAVLRIHQFADRHPLQHEFVKRLHRRYGEEGIEIPFPMRTVRMESVDD